ncbi:MAG TPA: hypothetical protein VFB52_08115 [Solirubrobacterales bacterium]|nr:hypothetical protein [Solirubrobacterales bacterium]
MKVEPVRPQRSRRRRVADLVVSIAMLVVLVALYLVVVSRGNLPF